MGWSLDQNYRLGICIGHLYRAIGREVGYTGYQLQKSYIPSKVYLCMLRNKRGAPMLDRGSSVCS